VKLPRKPIDPDHAIEAARRQLELRPEVVQVPTQPLLVLDAASDQVLAVVCQQLDLQGPFIQMGGGQCFGALLERRPGDRQGVDRIRLAGCALALARLAHQLRWDADDPLPRGDEEALERAGDVAAVLERPDPLLIERATPVE